MALSPRQLGQRLADAFVASDAAVSVESALHERPLMLQVRVGTTTIPLRVFIWRITHGGASRAAGEYRVQTTRPQSQPFLTVGGRQTLLLGHHEELDVFAAWDVRKHPNPGPSSSLQVSLETLGEAREQGFTSASRDTDSGAESVMAFRPDSAVAYLEVTERLDGAGIDSAIPAVEAATSGAPVPDDSLPAGGERRREIHEVAALVRDRRFRTAVLRAYGERCAFCGLGLGIVEAAHIQGVADNGPDVLSNGMAACPNHHKAFDRGLLLVQDDNSIYVNEDRAAVLGLEAAQLVLFKEGLLDRLRLPSDSAAYPDRARLEHHRSKWS
jgi:putative restriction endonuclease